MACCPPNIGRTLASLGNYIYSCSEEEVYVNLFVSSEAQVEVHGTQVSLTQETQYPFNNRVEFNVNCNQEVEFSIKLRIPEWCNNRGEGEMLVWIRTN